MINMKLYCSDRIVIERLAQISPIHHSSLLDIAVVSVRHLLDPAGGGGDGLSNSPQGKGTFVPLP